VVGACLDHRHSEQEWTKSARRVRVEVIEDAGQWVLVDQRYHARVSVLVDGFIQEVLRMEQEEEERKKEELQHELDRKKRCSMQSEAAAAAILREADWLFAKEPL